MAAYVIHVVTDERRILLFVSLRHRVYYAMANLLGDGRDRCFQDFDAFHIDGMPTSLVD